MGFQNPRWAANRPQGNVFSKRSPERKLKVECLKWGFQKKCIFGTSNEANEAHLWKPSTCSRHNTDYKLFLFLFFTFLHNCYVPSCVISSGFSCLCLTAYSISPRSCIISAHSWMQLIRHTDTHHFLYNSSGSSTCDWLYKIKVIPAMWVWVTPQVPLIISGPRLEALLSPALVSINFHLAVLVCIVCIRQETQKTRTE